MSLWHPSSSLERPASEGLPPAASAITANIEDLGHPEAPPEESRKDETMCA